MAFQHSCSDSFAIDKVNTNNWIYIIQTEEIPDYIKGYAIT